MSDFADIMKPILEGGSWANTTFTPKVVTKNKAGPTHQSSRGNKNTRVEIKNQDGINQDPVLAFENTVIYDNHTGTITAISTSNTERENMKLDIIAILKAAPLQFTYKINNDPKRRNKEHASFLVSIIDC